MRRLLVANPKDRMTATEALNHPWVREGGVASSQPIDDTVMKRLKKFSEMTKFKKTALKARVGASACSRSRTLELVVAMLQLTNPRPQTKRCAAPRNKGGTLFGIALPSSPGQRSDR